MRSRPRRHFTRALALGFVAAMAASPPLEAADGGDAAPPPLEGGTGGVLEGGTGGTFEGGTGGTLEAGALCGNGVRDPDEACDRFDFGGATCASVSLGVRTGGTLGCSARCAFDASACVGGEGGPGGTGGRPAATGGAGGALAGGGGPGAGGRFFVMDAGAGDSAPTGAGGAREPPVTSGGAGGRPFSSGGSNGLCSPGALERCPCSADKEGVRECTAQGAFGECECPGSGSANDDGGCGCAVPGRGATGPAWLAIAAAGLVAAARRVRSRRPRHTRVRGAEARRASVAAVSTAGGKT